MIKIKRKKVFDKSAEITSLIDIVFILLIFFLLTAVMPPDGLSINLPQAETTNEKAEAPFMISLSEEEKIYFNGKEISREDLKLELEKLSPDSKVTLYGDQKISYALFVEVMDMIRSQGTHQIILAAEKK